MNFSEFNFEPELLDGLDAMGFEKATPIQEQAIPLIQQHRDLIACAQTGTGKTAAFLLPIMNRIVQNPNRKGINTLIIAPTRELAIQIDQQVEGFGYFIGVSSCPIYGGNNPKLWDQQKQAITKGADILIATPGRLISHLNLNYADMSSVEHLILDEADRMLDMGFHEDIMHIIGKLPAKRQTLLFSATMPPKIRTLSKELLQNPEQISIAVSKPADKILQAAYLTYDNQKVPLIQELLQKDTYHKVIVFCSTKKSVKAITQALKAKKLKVREIHSDLTQPERVEVLQKYKANRFNILVATDIMSRGIDIDDISLVINHDVPRDPEDYIHRIGRTARADAEGVGLTFINEKDQRNFAKIEKLIEKEISKLPLPPSLGSGPRYTQSSSGGRKQSNNRSNRGNNRDRNRGRDNNRNRNRDSDRRSSNSRRDNKDTRKPAQRPTQNTATPKPKTATKPKVELKARPTTTPKPKVTTKPRPTTTPKPKVTAKPRPTTTPKPKVTTKPKPTTTPKPKVTAKPKPTTTPKPKVEAKPKPKRTVTKPKVSPIVRPKKNDPADPFKQGPIEEWD